MLREYTCIICSNECDTKAQIEEREDGTRRTCSVKGVACPEGRAYVEQEAVAPHRNIATPVLVKGGILPLASVRLTNLTPRGRVFDAMDEIKKCALTTSAKAGTVVIPHLLGYDAGVIVTKPVSGNGCR